MAEPLLSVQNLSVTYGAIRALHGVSMEVYEGEIVCVIGANGAGKSTLLNAIMGDCAGNRRGDLRRQAPCQEELSGRCPGRVAGARGQEDIQPLTVHENLMIGAFPRKDMRQIEEDLEWVYGLFPRLQERKDQYAGTLSGGEQKMLAIGRALMSRPRLLLLDEPSLGLAPILIKEIFKELKRINGEGVTMLLVEQNARQALMLSNRGYVLQTGRIVLQGPSQELLVNPDVTAAYLGKLKK